MCNAPAISTLKEESDSQQKASPGYAADNFVSFCFYRFHSLHHSSSAQGRVDLLCATTQRGCVWVTMGETQLRLSSNTARAVPSPSSCPSPWTSNENGLSLASPARKCWSDTAPTTPGHLQPYSITGSNMLQFYIQPTSVGWVFAFVFLKPGLELSNPALRHWPVPDK